MGGADAGARGPHVVVLDAHRVGFGASGRNGGQVNLGFNQSQQELEAQLGEARARALWDLAEEARRQLRDFCATHAPEAAYRPGSAFAEYSPRAMAELEAEAAFLDQRYGFPLEVMGRDAFAALVKSPLYAGGLMDQGGGHLHPLAYARALAREAEAAGASIHELSEVTQASTEGRHVVLKTRAGQVTAAPRDHRGQRLPPDILPAVNAKVMPINSFIAATEPLPDRWQDVLARGHLRRGCEIRGELLPVQRRSPLSLRRAAKATASASRRHLNGIDRADGDPFPQLKGVGISHVWGGSLGITMTRLPHVARVGTNILSGAGFSGHGVALSGMAGRVMAEAVLGQEDGLTTFETLPVPRFPGGTVFRAPLLTLAMTWYACATASASDAGKPHRQKDTTVL
jgi:gamma-glutamylputrescine oxidase